jgi:hypothetical protein
VAAVLTEVFGAGRVVREVHLAIEKPDRTS